MNSLRRLVAGGARKQELRYIAVSLLFLVGGILAVWFVHGVVAVEGDAILVALLVVPLLLYLTLSGKVSELGGGGFSVKLREVRRQPAVDASAVVAELGPEFDPANPIVTKMNPNRPRVMTLRLGQVYDRENVLGSLRNIAGLNPVPVVIVQDEHRQVQAYMTYRSALDLLERPERGDAFIDLVKGGRPGAFDDGGGFSALLTRTIPDDATNAEALAIMEESGLDTLVAVDRARRFAGLVERNRVLSRMMLALVAQPSET